jgi:predicted porin
MNKKLVALAVAGAVASPLAAQAQTANVVLYGRLNLDYEFVDNGDETIHRLSSNSSRLGVRGEENLGGGLTAIFQIESSINGDAGGGTLASRDTFAGIRGNFGTVRFGNMLMPHDDIHGVFGNGPTYLTSILSTAALWANGTLPKGSGGFDARIGNSVRYDSPVMGGFRGAVQYATQENDRKGNIFGIGGGWTGGPFTAAVAYERDDDFRADSTTDEALSIAGNWTFGNFKVGAVWNRVKYDGAGADFDRDFWGVSLTAKLGPGSLYAFYGDAGNNKGNGSINGGADEISYTYDLSKRTSVYAGYVRINNDNNANYTFNINPVPVPDGENPQAFLIGMLHLF